MHPFLLTLQPLAIPWRRRPDCRDQPRPPRSGLKSGGLE
jgi:hypothetical protein